MPKEYQYSGEFAKFYQNIEVKTSITKAAKLFCKEKGITYTDRERRLLSRALQVRNITQQTEIEDSKDFKDAQKRKFKKSKYYIITTAQNATPVHEGFLENVLAYKKNLKAEMIVIASRYKNPTSIFIEKSDDWWASEITQYLSAKRVKIHPHLEVLADIKINPTASMPLSGLNGVSGIESCILGHPRVHLTSLPVLDNYPKKVLATTGMCTVANYTDSKAGKKGEFHHNLGFIIVEIKNDKIFYIRQVVADENGAFYDLKTKASEGKVTENLEPLPAIILGDIHLGNHDEIALQKSLEMCKKYKPKYTVLHDLFDGHSISHHELKSPFTLLEREENGTNNLKRELWEMTKFLNDNKKDNNFVIVRSNHDDFLDRFLDGTDWRKEINKKEYLELAYLKSQGKMKDGVIPYIARLHGIKALGINDSFVVKNCELGLHGHLGASGSRGSVNQFKNLNTKTVTGHSHSPSRIDGSCSVGTLSNLRQGYNNGLSAWLHCNVIIQPDGSRQHIIMINGLYTTIKDN